MPRAAEALAGLDPEPLLKALLAKDFMPTGLVLRRIYDVPGEDNQGIAWVGIDGDGTIQLGVTANPENGAESASVSFSPTESEGKHPLVRQAIIFLAAAMMMEDAGG